jgi:uncharacterized protein YllA (UPF0747 family)
MGKTVNTPDLKPMHFVYNGYVQNPSRYRVATQLWGYIPSTMHDAYQQLTRVRNEYGVISEDLEPLKHAMKSNLRTLGILTRSVKDNIERMDFGVVESGQQPMVIGGPSLILNKIAYISTLSNLGDKKFVPLFYVADYDGVQPELINMRIPSPSSRGVLLSYPLDPKLMDAPIREIELPDEEWLKKTLEKISSNYKGILKGVNFDRSEKILNTLEHIQTVIKNAYYSTGNVSDFSTKIIGTIVNIISEIGVPMLNATAPEIRIYFQSGYEILLSEPNRSRFIETSNTTVDIIDREGYQQPIGKRAEDYVPFFLECQSKDCHRKRIELHYIDNGKNNAYVKGKCPNCEQEYEYSFNKKKPDISEFTQYVTPRVDSRQIIVDSTIPVLGHVGGPGETSYYAQVIPAAKALQIPFPVYIKYNRVFYNTPWNEQYAKILGEEGLPTLNDEKLFNALNQWVEARKKTDAAMFKEAHKNIGHVIESNFESLLSRCNRLKVKIEELKQKLREPGDRGALVKELREFQNKLQGIELYLSSAYGRFSPEKYGQEVNWAWIDLALTSDLSDVMGVYQRQYHEYTPNSAVYYVNLT